jgi:hypothetical protein
MKLEEYRGNSPASWGDPVVEYMTYKKPEMYNGTWGLVNITARRHVEKLKCSKQQD